MKGKIFVIIVATIIMFSCQEDNLSIEPCQFVTNSITRSPMSSWDECNKCIIYTGDSVPLPWASSTTCSIPADIRQDVNQSDGWRLLYSNVKIVGYSHPVDSLFGASYLILYNKYSGVLKGFYYAPDVQQNNYAYWVLTIPQTNTKLFNFATDFAVPADNSATQDVVLSNVSNNGFTHGFEKGWNCFMQELAYDENSLNETLEIMGYSMNQATYNFSGAYHSTSSGTIISSSGGGSSIASGIINGLSSAVGDSAKNWIVNNSTTPSNPNRPIKKQLTSTILQNLASNVMPTLLAAGINTVFSSLIGQGGPSTYGLDFTTNGSVNITGTGVTPASGNIMPIAGIPLNGIGEKLGVWNLVETPKFRITQIPELVYYYQNSSGAIYWYKVTGTKTFNVVKNPDVNNNFTSSSSLAKYTLYHGNYPNFWTSNKFYHAYTTNGVSGCNQVLIYSDSITTIYTTPQTYVVVASNCFPNKKTTSNKPAFDFYNSDWEIRDYLAFKIETKVFTGNGYYSCKTFIPENKVLFDGSARPYNWTFNELNSGGYNIMPNGINSGASEESLEDSICEVLELQ